MLGWDTSVALAFAAEELFLAAQALTTDLISRERGLQEAHQHLRGLIVHERLLTGDIAAGLRTLDGKYTERENSHATDQAGEQILIATTLELLGQIHETLQENYRKAA